VLSEATFNKLKQKQNASGGFPWFVAMKKMNTSQGILAGLGIWQN
jgi:hypothetical protein